MVYKISKLKLNNFFSNLQADYQVYLPTLKDQIYEFEVLRDDSIYNLLESTYSSFKKIIFPIRQPVCKFEKNNFFKIDTFEKRIIFGLSTEDILALNTLKGVSEENISDSIMVANIENTTFVLIVNGTKQGNIVTTAEIAKGYDLLMIKVEEEFYFDIATEKGKVAAGYIKLNTENVKINKTYFTEFALFENKKFIRDTVEKSREDKIWQDLAEICLGCGNCTDVCPLCYCFDIKDEFTGKSCGYRCKWWDSCFYKKFDQVSNYNFRENLKDRIYHYFHHKFVQAFDERQEFNCNHCGRCVRSCPVDINIFKIIADLVKKYGEKNEK